ncbi:MAG TPA: ABC transporter permease [Vicinamibacterales bacterium]|nr:ABC transporter permease [Vicinamibacterales bacterium]
MAISAESFVADVRQSLRQLTRRRGFTAIALLTLALGIGAPTAIFSVVRGVLLRPLPYPDADRVVTFEMRSEGPGGPVTFDALPASEAIGWAAESNTLASLALFNDRALTLTTPDGPFRLPGVSATPNLFEVLGTAPAIGSTFGPASASTREIVLSHGTWTGFFGGSRQVIGSLITMDGEPYRVVGVMPEAFQFPSPETTFWIAQELNAGGTRGMLLPAVGKLKPGATVAGVTEEGRSRVVAGDPRFKATLIVKTLRDQMVGGVQRLLWVLVGAVAFVSVIATANLALLLLTRGAAREREFAIRSALGAGRRRLLRQLTIEGLTIGSIGGAAGLALTWLSLRVLIAQAPGAIPRLQDVAIDAPVLMFASFLTIGCTLAVGILSASRILGLGPARVLGTGPVEGRLTGQTSPHQRRLNMLAAAELALTTVLLVGAGLLLRSFAGLVMTDQGFDAGGTLAFQVNLPASRYPSAAARLAFDERLLEAVQHAPGVQAAGLATTLPTRQATGRFAFTSSPELAALGDPQQMPIVDVHMVTDGFADAMGLRMIGGRSFTRGDTSGNELVMVISEQFAKQQFPKGNAVGQVLFSPSGDRRVIGVVGDVRTAELGAPLKPDVYLPLRQNFGVLGWFSSITVLARGGDSAALAAQLRPVILALDPQSPPYNARALHADADTVVAGPRFGAAVLSMFAFVALAMACLGVYGVMAYATRLRTREIGVRVAVGATRTEILALMMKQGVGIVAIGVTAGLVAAIALARVLTGLLHEVTPADTATLVTVALLLGVSGLAATLIPSLRATRIDALKALRED